MINGGAPCNHQILFDACEHMAHMRAWPLEGSVLVAATLGRSKENTCAKVSNKIDVFKMTQFPALVVSRPKVAIPYTEFIGETRGKIGPSNLRFPRPEI